MSTVVSKADCCLDSCCVECDPDLPDIETPFWGSVHEMPNTLTEEGKFHRKGFPRIPDIYLDGTEYESVGYNGQAYVSMWNRTIFEETFAFIFSAQYNDGHVVEVAVHELFGNEEEAEYQANRFSDVMGRVPLLFREKIENLYLRPGNLNLKLEYKSEIYSHFRNLCGRLRCMGWRWQWWHCHPLHRCWRRITSEGKLRGSVCS